MGQRIYSPEMVDEATEVGCVEVDNWTNWDVVTVSVANDAVDVGVEVEFRTASFLGNVVTLVVGVVAVVTNEESLRLLITLLVVISATWHGVPFASFFIAIVLKGRLVAAEVVIRWSLGDMIVVVGDGSDVSATEAFKLFVAPSTRENGKKKANVQR